MKITYYLYNSFVIEWNDKKIAMDPGALFAYYLSFATLIPKSEWKGITHVFVTHGDPDHYWHTDRILNASGAQVILNKTMLKEVEGKSLFLGPRSKGVAFDTSFPNYHTLAVEESIDVDGMGISGIRSKHGPLTIGIGPFKKTETPGPQERIGWGNMGFEIHYGGKTILNLGDSLLLEEDWEKLQSPDVLMIPIGGRKIGNTMNEEEALEAVKLIKPRLVIPTHYNCPILFTKHGNPANDLRFKFDVECMGFDCCILGKGEHVLL